ncbi:MAG: DUF2764 family protein [Rikenellaceae bacterium]
MAEYYCLVAGLTDFGFDVDRKMLNYAAIKEEIMDTITRRDRAKLELLMGFYDIQNIIGQAVGRGERYTPLGGLPQETIRWITPLLKKERKADEDEEQLLIPKFIEKALKAITDEEWAKKNEVDTTMPLENLLFTFYYDFVEHNDKGFVRDWCNSDRNIRNITAAHKARSLGLNAEKYLIGNNHVTEQLKTNSAPDFGLKNEVPFVEELIGILSNDNILKKESDLDLLRINIIEDMNTFNYFNIDVILGYYLKIAMIERWLALDPKLGHELFEKIVKGLSTMDFTDKIAEELK